MTTLSKEMREQIDKVKSFGKFLNEGVINSELEFKYNGKVYYINTNNRTVRTEQYDNIILKLPKRILLPNLSNSNFRQISDIEQSLEVDNIRYKDLQEYLKSINWNMENDKQKLKLQLEDFINDYGEDVLHNVINQLNVQFNKM